MFLKELVNNKESETKAYEHANTDYKGEYSRPN